MKSILIFTTIVLLFSSCKLLLGLKDPKELPEEKLITYQLKNKIDTSKSFVFNKIAFDSIQSLPYKPKWPIDFRPLQFKIFNNNGEIISQYSTCEGSIKKLHILERYPPSNWYYFDSSTTFDRDFRMYRNYDGNKININETKDDLSIVVYWGTWLGKPGKKMIKRLKKYMQKYSNKKISIYYINVGEIYK